MKHILCIIILLIPIYIMVVPEKYSKEESNYEENKNVVVRLLDNGKVINIDLEEYIVGVVSCEMPASFNVEALKAQAVASRTYALERLNEKNKYDLENSTNNQCYTNIENAKKKWGNNYDKYHNKIKEAVSDTFNQYMTYNGKIIKAFYFSTSNGYTETSENVFGTKLDYLVSVESSWDKQYSSYEKTTSFSEQDFIKKLDLKIDSVKRIEIESRTESGRVDIIKINGIKITGNNFRKKLGIRSTDVDIYKESDKIYITTRGFGHGVGLSQYGADGMAKEGYTYDEILKYYYKDIKIENV